MNRKTMWEADEIAQARLRIILRIYILTTHSYFTMVIILFQKNAFVSNAFGNKTGTV